MSPQTKLAIRRWTIRKLRLLFDYLDDRLHAAEVRLREELSLQNSPAASFSAQPARSKAPCAPSCAAGEIEFAGTAPEQCGKERAGTYFGEAEPARISFEQWEARRSGVAVVSKKSARRRRGMPARAFDLRFSTR